MNRMCWAAVVCSIAFGAAAARAHSRPPMVERIRFDPSDPDRIVVGFSYGLIITEDGGITWRWVCAGAYDSDAAVHDPDFDVADDGSLAIGVLSGIYHGAPDACRFDPPTGTAANTYVVQVVRDPHVTNAMWAATAAIPDPDRLQRSIDGGRTWALFGDAFPDVLIERIATAPSDPSRLYLTAYMRQAGGEPRRGFVLRSDDGGLEFERIEVPLIPDELEPHVIGVDPTNADRIFVRMRKSETDATYERLLFSEDGGRTYREVHSGPHLASFALSPDGRTAWVGSLDGGLWIARNGSLVFEQLSTTSIRCLAARTGELWMCLDSREGYEVGRSLDEGETFDPLLSFVDATELVPCERCDPTTVVCTELIDDFVYDIDRYYGSMTIPNPGFEDAGLLAECAIDAGMALDAGIAADSGVFDAGRADAGSALVPGGGCGCAVRAEPRAPVLAILLVLAVTARRDRRSAGRRRTNSR